MKILMLGMSWAYATHRHPHFVITTLFILFQVITYSTLLIKDCHLIFQLATWQIKMTPQTLVICSEGILYFTAD